MIIKIITVNIPEAYLDAIGKLIGEGGLYPSRSELVRVATRDFLIRELKNANDLLKYDEVPEENHDDDDENYVKVPFEKINGLGEPVKEFKTYKIIKRLS